jgi:hypothetical protein
MSHLPRVSEEQDAKMDSWALKRTRDNLAFPHVHLHKAGISIHRGIKLSDFAKKDLFLVAQMLEVRHGARHK